jgi:hypothetical protein
MSGSLLLGDHGYDADWIRKLVRQCGGGAATKSSDYGCDSEGPPSGGNGPVLRRPHINHCLRATPSAPLAP